MKHKRTLFLIFSWSYILMGVIHEVIITVQHSSSPPEEFIPLLNLMKATPVFNSNIYNFFVGYDFLIGLFFFLYGYLTKYILDSNKSILFKDKNIHYIIVLFNSVFLIIAIQFFFFLPIFFTALAFISHLLSIFIQEEK